MRRSPFELEALEAYHPHALPRLSAEALFAEETPFADETPFAEETPFLEEVLEEPEDEAAPGFAEEEAEASWPPWNEGELERALPPLAFEHEKTTTPKITKLPAQCMQWNRSPIPDVYSATIRHDHDDLRGDPKRSPAEMVVWSYAGVDPTQCAIVFGGIHGNEPESPAVTADLKRRLDAAYSDATPRKTAITTLLVLDLFPNDPPPGKKIDDTDRRINGADPNRNFPLAGESYATARARGQAATPKLPELLDPDQRGFKGKGPQKNPAHTMLTEIRMLVGVIGCGKPVRAVSVHSHTCINDRGDAPGIFVDPRGGLDPSLDAPLSAEGRIDDDTTDAMLAAAVARFNALIAAATKSSAKKALEKLRNTSFSGNKLDLHATPPKAHKIGGETVHYSFGATKLRGTSFGMWGPAPINENGPEDRPGMTTITLELPKCGGAGKMATLAPLWSAVLAEIFLGGGPTILEPSDKAAVTKEVPFLDEEEELEDEAAENDEATEPES
jgi:hypothetical protein